MMHSLQVCLHRLQLRNTYFIQGLVEYDEGWGQILWSLHFYFVDLSTDWTANENKAYRNLIDLHEL
jgi:hypothetical protein